MPEVPDGLALLGWAPHWSQQLALLDLPPGSRPARAIRVDRGGITLHDGTGPFTAPPSGSFEVSAGDWLVVDEEGLVVASLPRRTTVRRRVSSRRAEDQVLAANVDLVAVVASLSMDPDLGRLERLLSLAWLSGATPLVVLTKADLVDDADLIAAEVAGVAPTVDVLVVSATTGHGLQELSERLVPGSTVVLLGPSGVGKSTLVNALAGSAVVATGEVGASGKGRHVTTSRDLVALPSGAVVLDTPGLRGVGLVGDDEGVELAFPEIQALAQACRFRDCTHGSEPGCMVLEAVDRGELPLRRLESWRKLGREAAWMQRRTDARLMAEERKRWKAIQMSARRGGVTRP